ncbi:MAG: ABC transporter ATP-binding protein, partial [Blautia sp.]|nr:ABC transporter ATP-binding protein [Blautia sp.]
MSEQTNRMPRRRGPMRGEKAKDFKGSIKKLAAYLSRYRLKFLLMALCAMAGTCFSIVGPRTLGGATTELFTGLMAKVSGTGGINYGKITAILRNVLLLYGFSALFSLVQGFLMTGISNNATYELRRQISQKIHRLPLRYYEGRTTGEILSRVTNDVDTLQMGINQSITQLITSATTLIGVLFMMLSISVPMTLAALCILPISGFLISTVMKHSQKFFTGHQKYLGEVNGHIEEVYSGHNTVKVYGQEASYAKTFEELNDKLYETAWKSQFFSGLMQPLMAFIGNLGYCMVAILGGYMAIRGRIQVGDIQSFFQYIRSFNQPISQAAQVANMLQSSAAAAERVFEFLEEEEETDPMPTTEKITDIEGNVRFEHVRFGYDENAPIIHDFSAQVKAGQKIALVGPTGAGKTTMVKLLMRFYDVNGGHIYLDGKDIRSFDRGELRKDFGMVLQDTWLFSGTIMENIRYGKEGATDEEVIQAAKAAHIHSFIKQQSGGYQLVLGEDSSGISQGQRQLLTIA